MSADARTLMGAISRALGHIDANEIGDEASVERARAELWAAYDSELDPEAEGWASLPNSTESDDLMRDYRDWLLDHPGYRDSARALNAFSAGWRRGKRSASEVSRDSQ